MEKRAQYVGQLNPETLLEYNQGYAPPTPLEIKQLLNKHNLTAKRVAEICGMSSDRSVRKWTSPKEFVQPDGTVRPAANALEIPYACWRLLLITLGEVPVNVLR